MRPKSYASSRSTMSSQRRLTGPPARLRSTGPGRERAVDLSVFRRSRCRSMASPSAQITAAWGKRRTLAIAARRAADWRAGVLLDYGGMLTGNALSRRWTSAVSDAQSAGHIRAWEAVRGRGTPCAGPQPPWLSVRCCSAQGPIVPSALGQAQSPSAQWRSCSCWCQLPARRRVVATAETAEIALHAAGTVVLGAELQSRTDLSSIGRGRPRFSCGP
jgi:hypothetical protein